MAAKKTRIYGLHLMIDGYGADKEKLADVSLIYETLLEMPALIDMQRVGFPHIIQFKEAEIAGLSGFIFIVESHISIHTYSNKGFISMDAYSCKTFNPDILIKHIKETFGIQTMETNTVVRGKRFPINFRDPADKHFDSETNKRGNR